MFDDLANIVPGYHRVVSIALFGCPGLSAPAEYFNGCGSEH